MPEDIFHSDDSHKRLSMKIKKDVFYEMSVFPTSSSSNLFFIVYMAFAIIMGIISFALLLMGGLSNLLMFTFAVVFGFLCAFFYYMSQRSRVEYDYTFTNGTLDIAKILNGKTRKKVLSLDAEEIMDMQPITSEAFQKYFDDKNIKKANMFLNKGTHLYYMLFVKEEKKVVVIFEPDQQLIEYMKMFNTDNIIA